VLWSALVMLAASNTFDPNHLRYLVPLYVLLLALSLREYVCDETGERSARLGRGHWAALGAAAGGLVLAFFLGGALHYGLFTYRQQLTEWSNELLLAKLLAPLAGMAANPELGASYDIQLSPMRVLRVEGLEGGGGLEAGAHLRGAAFVDYSGGRWGPGLHERFYETAVPLDLQPQAPGPRARFTRFHDEYHLLFTPLHAAGLAPEGEDEIRWSTELGTVLRGEGRGPMPYRYEVVLEGKGGPGPFARPLGDRERKRHLAVPPFVQARLGDLARQIGGGRATPREKVRAVESYLLTHNRYSLRTDPGQGDPVVNFLLEGKAAHCQYFATAAVILLRMLGVPARYVSGYYAHEGGAPGVTIVRQRDAHAWVEAWIDGQGWTTVDATPGDGRPDRLWSGLPVWLQGWEWAQDRFLGAVAALSDVRRLLPLAVTACILGFGALAWRALRRKRTGAGEARGYASPGEEVSALSRRFEALLARAGLQCPEHRPWSEYLSEHLEGPSARREDGRAGLDLGRAREFLRRYNSLRFGHPEDASGIAALRELLRDMEAGNG